MGKAKMSDSTVITHVDWSVGGMEEKYGSGPLNVTATRTVRNASCSPGEHLHITVKLSGNKSGTFCGKFFKVVATAEHPPEQPARVSTWRNRRRPYGGDRIARIPPQ